MSNALRTIEPAGAKPWLAPDLLPLKPDQGDYGYKRGKDLVSCTKEELIAACRPGSGLEINLVWHPDSDRLVPVSDVAFLRDALRQRAKSALNWVLAGGLLNIAGIVLARRDATPGWSDLLWVNLFLFGVLPLLQWGYDTWEFRRSQDGMDPAVLEAARFGVWIDQQGPTLVWIPVLTSAAVTVLAFVYGLESAIHKAGLDKAAVFQGEIWRLLSGPLMHGSIPHVFFNLIGIAVLGPVVEALGGRGVMAVVLLVSTLCGSLLSCLCMPDVPSVGISGGVMGLLGFLLVLGHRRRELVPAMLPKDLLRGLLITAITGLAAWKFIDNAAHLGGALAGAGLGLWVAAKAKSLPQPNERSTQIAGHLSLATLVAVGIYTVIRIVGSTA